MSRSTVASRRQIFLDIVTQSNTSCQNGDYTTAVTLYSEALKMDPNNHILYSNRSAAFIKLGQFSRALQDALKARELNSKWSKVKTPFLCIIPFHFSFYWRMNDLVSYTAYMITFWLD